MHVAIIGAGLAGVATCKALSIRGISCTVFDPQPTVGGLWVANYPGADVQAPHSQFQYADTRFPTPMHGRASAAEVVAYCEGYVREGGLEGCLRLGTRVERVAQRPGGGFTLTTRPVGGSSSTVVEEATHVAVCTGMFSANPCMPEFPGLDTFTGRALHTSQRRDDEADFRGKRVLVVGGGKSAQEAAAAALRAGASTVALALRQPHLLVPFRICGLIPYHWAFANPVVLKILPVYPGQRPLRPLGRVARAATAPVRGLLWRTLKVVMLLHYRLPMRLWPRPSMESEMMGAQGPSIYSKTYIRGARSGKIDVRVAEVASVHPGSVTLRSRAGGRGGAAEEIPVDTLVLGTGFVDGHPFLDGSIEKALDRQPDGLPLYRHIVPPQLPGVFFVGRAASFTNPLTASVQAAWLGELLCGRVTLPPAADMRADADRWAAAMATAPLSSARRHLIALQGNRYAHQLLEDMGVAHLARYGGPFGRVANTVMPQNPENYANAVQPPEQRTRRRLRPPLWLKAATIAVVAGVAQAVRRRPVHPAA